MKGKIMAKNIMRNKGIVDENLLISGVPLRQLIEAVPLNQEVAGLIISIVCFRNMGKQEILEKVREAHRYLGGKETSDDAARTAITAALRLLVKQGKAIKAFKGFYHFPFEGKKG